MTQPGISFEYFPPRTEAGRERLLEETTPALQRLQPAFFSCTYGADGSARDNTLELVSAIRETGADVAPHLSFGGDSEEAVGKLLDHYAGLGVNRLVVLRGDTPPGMDGAKLPGARELVEFVREHNGGHFSIAVAAYPEVHPRAASSDSDIQALKNKIDAGADVAITQYFYNAEAYFYFVDRCAAVGIHKPIHAGIMPITDFARLANFSDNCGAEIPRWIRRRLEDIQDDSAAVREFGIEAVSRLCRTLVEGGCPGIHFYTMNQAEPTATICANLALG